MVKGAEEDKPGLNESPFCAVEVTFAYVVTFRQTVIPYLSKDSYDDRGALHQ